MKQLPNVFDCQLVLIEWVDSFGATGEWESLAGIGEADDSIKEMVCYSVGWLVKETKTAIFVAPHVAPSDVLKLGEMNPEAWDGCGMMGIPVPAVRNRSVLASVKEPRSRASKKKGRR